MKAQLICVSLVLCVSAVLCMPPDFQTLMKECMGEAQVSEAELKEFFASGIKADVKENMKCYTKCLMEKQGHMKAGVFNAEAVIATLKKVPQFKDVQDEIAGGVNACKDLKGSNDCDTSFKITMCLKEQKANFRN